MVALIPLAFVVVLRILETCRNIGVEEREKGLRSRPGFGATLFMLLVVTEIHLQD
jgi:hypothetical protein